MEIQKENQEKYNRLLTLEWVRAEIFRGLDSQSTEPPVCSNFSDFVRPVGGGVDGFLVLRSPACSVA
jgi:hypothetical protein